MSDTLRIVAPIGVGILLAVFMFTAGWMIGYVKGLHDGKEKRDE